MPPVSQAQRGAMAAAAGGNSTIGIPKKVGQEFMNADEGGKLPAKKKPEKSHAKRLYKNKGIAARNKAAAAKAPPPMPAQMPPGVQNG
jgi:hypothetical protein